MNKPSTRIPFSIPAILFRLCLVPGLLAAVPGIAPVAKASATAFPTAELSKLPYLHFSENNLGLELRP